MLIVSKYLGATNTKPSRIKVSCGNMTQITSLDYNLDIIDNHIYKLRLFCKKFDIGVYHKGQSIKFAMSESVDKSGFYFVAINKNNEIEI